MHVMGYTGVPSLKATVIIQVKDACLSLDSDSERKEKSHLWSRSQSPLLWPENWRWYAR